MFLDAQPEEEEPGTQVLELSLPFFLYLLSSLVVALVHVLWCDQFGGFGCGWSAGCW